VFATGADFCAPSERVPGCIRPFNFGMFTHKSVGGTRNILS
jgi:hypothetical protein